MYNIYDGSRWISFDTYIELVNYLAQFNVGSHISWRYNTFLDRVGANKNDVYRASILDYPTVTYLPRDYRVLEGNTSVYGPSLIKDVLNRTVNSEMLHDTFKKINPKRRSKWHRWDLPKSAYPEFRRGPMPYIHKHHRYYSYRRVRTTNEIRQSVIPEYKDFVRKSRGKHLPSLYWDEPMRDWRNDGWKKQGKRRHQWENKVITFSNHKFGKGIYVEKLCDSTLNDFDTVENLDKAS